MPPFIHKPRRKAVLVAAGALVLVLLGALAGSVVLLSGAYSTAATTQHFRLTHWLLDTGLRYSVRTNARNIEVPALDAPGMIQRGASCYQSYCVQCHGAPGIARDEGGRGMLPIASNLAQSARDWPPRWLYYVTKKGVRMSGMPAWEFRMSEESLWSTVAFLGSLPLLTREEYLDAISKTSPEQCTPPSEAPITLTKDYAKVAFRQYACDSCHRIEGVVGPDSRVGPPLFDWSKRKYIAGVVPNTHENLVRFIRAPHAVAPGTLMPDLDVVEPHAIEMAAYLLALE
jgi:mono/diheme cytochrome c family protein